MITSGYYPLRNNMIINNNDDYSHIQRLNIYEELRKN